MIALNPQQTFKFFLDVEVQRAEGNRTVFVSRFLSAGMLAQIDELTDEASAKTGEEERQILLQAIALGFVKFGKPDGGDKVIRITLDIEAEKPPAERITIFCRLYTADELERVNRLIADAASAKPSLRLEKLKAAIAIGLSSVYAPTGDAPSLSDMTFEELLEIASKLAQLSRLALARDLTDLSMDDLWEIAIKMIRLSRLTEIERKKSALQSASAAAAKSAKTVNLASA